MRSARAKPRQPSAQICLPGPLGKQPARSFHLSIVLVLSGQADALVHHQCGGYFFYVKDIWLRTIFRLFG